MLDLLSVVRLKPGTPHYEKHGAAIGTIVEVFTAPTPAYEVELVGDDGETLALITLKPGEVEPHAA